MAALAYIAFNINLVPEEEHTTGGTEEGKASAKLLLNLLQSLSSSLTTLTGEGIFIEDTCNSVSMAVHDV